MISGKKVITISDSEPFEFLAGDVIVVAPNEISQIDFPEADKESVRCIVIEITDEKVSSVLDRSEFEASPGRGSKGWPWDDNAFTRLTADRTLNLFFRRLLEIFRERIPQKNLVIDNCITELIIRLLQTQSRKHIVECYQKESLQCGIKAAVRHAEKNLQMRISTTDLASVAGMSKANFYRHFKTELGISPHQFLQNLRIRRACDLLRDRKNSISEVCSSSGFNSLSHFIHTFKEQKGITPKSYQYKFSRSAEYPVEIHGMD